MFTLRLRQLVVYYWEQNTQENHFGTESGGSQVFVGYELVYEAHSQRR